MANNIDTRYTEIAELVNITNKYYPGIQQFRLNSLVTGELNETQTNNKRNIQNKDSNALGISTTTQANVVEIKLPKEHTITYQKKFIPAGTKFLVCFIGGDISSPKIIGRIDD
jgi:hypothetical protein